jgi:hypothetical protein
VAVRLSLVVDVVMSGPAQSMIAGISTRNPLPPRGALEDDGVLDRHVDVDVS